MPSGRKGHEQFRPIFYSFIKAAVCCGAWLCSLVALKQISVSIYGIMDLSRMVFSTSLAVVFLGESLTIPKILGMGLVVLGLVMVNLKKNSEPQKMTFFILIMALLNCFLNAVSGTMDKALMKHMDSSQLQFWFMFFMLSMVNSKTKISPNGVLTTISSGLIQTSS